MNDSWFRRLLEAETDEEVDSVIKSAIDTDDAMGMEDVNHASTSILDNNASDDPNELVYDKDLYSQTVQMGDERTSGSVDNSPTDDAVTSTQVESLLSPEEYRVIYSECVAELIRESKAILNEKFDAKAKAAQRWKAGKLAEKAAKRGRRAKQEAYAESGDINQVIDQVFSRFRS